MIAKLEKLNQELIELIHQINWRTSQTYCQKWLKNVEQQYKQTHFLYHDKFKDFLKEEQEAEDVERSILRCDYRDLKKTRDNLQAEIENSWGIE